jgi:hypothetical protein
MQATPPVFFVSIYLDFFGDSFFDRLAPTPLKINRPYRRVRGNFPSPQNHAWRGSATQAGEY